MTSFLDSNVLLYLLGPSDLKYRRAAELVDAGGIISAQVLNEFVHVARKKLKLDLPTILESLSPLRDALGVVSLTLDTHQRAMELASVTNLDTNDCNIIAAAELAGCDTLYTEDMNRGQRIGGVMVRNPFREA
jgi:predicted nucleic acid-binding protein